MDNKTQPNDFNLPQPVADSSSSAMTQGALPMPPPPGGGTPSAPASSKAQDFDTIEPEWIRAVDTLMRQMIDDPRRLSEELGKLRARYVRERYGKEIKSSEDQGQ